MECEDAGHGGQTQDSLAKQVEHSVQLPLLPDGIGDGDIKVRIMVRHPQIMQRCAKGLGGFGSLQELPPSPRFLIGELAEFEDDILSVRPLVPIGSGQAVRPVAVAFRVADSPREVKRFSIDHMQLLDVNIFIKGSIHEEKLDH